MAEQNQQSNADRLKELAREREAARNRQQEAEIQLRRLKDQQSR